MAEPVVSSVTNYLQGTGQNYLPKEPCVALQVYFTSTSSHACDFEVEFSPDNGGNWYDATMHHFGRGLNVLPSVSSPTLLVIDLRNSVSNNALTPQAWAQFKVRFKITDKVTSEQMVSWHTHATAIAVKASVPEVESISINQWTGAAVASFAPYAVTASDEGDPISNANSNYHYRASLNPSDLDPGSSLGFSVNFVTAPTFNFGTTVQGEYTIYYRVYDRFYNASDLASITTFLQRTPPQNCVLRITGTNGNNDYTGIEIQSDGSFDVDRDVRLDLGSSSDTEIPLYFTILDSSQVELDDNIGTKLPLTVENLVQYATLTTNRSNPTSDNFNKDVTVTISVKFEDAAANFTVVNKTIRLNTRVYLAQNTPIREPNPDYTYKVTYLNTSGVEVTVPRTQISTSVVNRKWKDIFYPTTHGYPRNTDGDLDVAAVQADANLRVMLATNSYDPILLKTNVNPPVPVYDSEGRPINALWTQDGTKNYANMESNDQSSPRYWVIDNIGYGDFQVEFGFFDLDSTVYGPPFNTQSPYEGDVLVMYDASENGTLQLTVNENGMESWRIVDSTKLVELAAFTGSGSNVVDLKSGRRMNSTAKGEFITDILKNITHVAFVLYTDDSGRSSGFQIKSGKAHDLIYKNYDVDEENGQIWIHMHETVSNTAVRGAADTTVKRFYYDYFPEVVSVNHTNGQVTFSVPPSGAQIVEVDAAFWHTMDYSSKKFIASHDDHVDYYDSPVYVAPSGVVKISNADKLDLYELDGHGRIIQGYAWDKDRGLIEFITVDPIPSGKRLTADYYHHTYTRLTNDGYGTFVFRDKILVADVTPYYPDFSWSDVKIINESDTELLDMQIKMVPRGYDTNGDGNATFTGDNVVDQVLDINRPWDIQEGTKDETFDKSAMGILPNYQWIRQCPKTGGTGLTGSSGATAILGTWKNRVYGTLAPRARAFGRVVWVLGGTGGSTYPSGLSSGRKTWSLEAQGKFYTNLVL